MLVPPELLAGGLARSAWYPERRPSPAALSAARMPGNNHRGACASLHTSASAPSVCRPATTQWCFVALVADFASPVEEHDPRILRLAERKINTACSNGKISVTRDPRLLIGVRAAEIMATPAFSCGLS